MPNKSTMKKNNIFVNHKNITQNTLVRYLAVGGSSYVLEITVLYGLKTAGLSSVAAVAISFWFGLLFAFFTQKLIAFKDKNSSKKAYAKQFTIYLALVAFNYAFTLGFVALFDTMLSVYLLRTIALAITTIWNFFVYKFIFHSNENEDNYI
jgi:putative flippase GtrA